jgi:polyhydroxyalkanoate synthesis regulator phasin
MNPTIANLVAQEHVNDLIRQAQSRRRYVEARPRRRIRFILPRLLARTARRSGLTVAANPSNSPQR